jgi:hypothetical protein
MAPVFAGFAGQGFGIVVGLLYLLVLMQDLVFFGVSFAAIYH